MFPALSGWRAIASIADLPILPIPQAAPKTHNAAPIAAAIFAISIINCLLMVYK
jgi:hypothetical protein